MNLITKIAVVLIGLLLILKVCDWISIKINERESVKRMVYPEFTRKSINSLLRSGKKIKNKEMTPWYSEKLKNMEEKMRNLRLSYESFSSPEEKDSCRTVLIDEAYKMIEFCQDQKSRYRFVLHRSDKKKLNAQIIFAEALLAEI